MNAPTTLVAFALGLTAVFGGSLALGSVTGPIGPSLTSEEHGGGHEDAGSSGHGSDSPSVAALPAGLSAAEEGYELLLASPTLTAGRAGVLAFTVNGPDGRPLTTYTPTHTKDLHLIVVRRDLTVFDHVHPTRDAGGTWSVPLVLDEPGAYKVFADFAPEGRDTALILGTDLTVAGAYVPDTLPAVSTTAVVDDYSVTLAGDLTAGKDSEVTLSVSKAGLPVTDLQPYLGTFGHLVAIRTGDLGYLHVHPEQGPAGPGITFTVDVPTAGTYRMFLDFQHGDRVRTAAFTVTAKRG